MKINEKLHLVVPVDRDGTTVYVHSAPISNEVFETYFMVIGQAFATVQAKFGAVSGMRLSWLTLRQAAIDNNQWEGHAGVESGLFGEIIRLTNVVAPNETAPGWRIFPFEDAIRHGFFDEDDLSEVRNAIAFFIICSRMLRKSVLPIYMSGAAKLWGAQTSSLSCTEYAAFLTKLIEAESTGATPIAA